MKTLISLSGGMDSATLLAVALEEGKQVECVGFHYGSKHNHWEQQAAVRLVEHYQVPYHLIDLSVVMASFSSALMLKGGNVPEGHYEAETMKQTVVPGRNSIFTSVLLGLAESKDVGEICLGVHKGDHYIYPDCRPQWFYAMAQVVHLASEGKVGLLAPFLNMDKAGILRRGLSLDVPYQLTRTCYKGQEIACGRCGSCQERLEAFLRVGERDPIPYENRVLLPREV